MNSYKALSMDPHISKNEKIKGTKQRAMYQRPDCFSTNYAVKLVVHIYNTSSRPCQLKKSRKTKSQGLLLPVSEFTVH
jgi:hypothetical protein